ncbi:MAG TPA: TonB-dependent receptor [Bacteroidota bacterium]|nr:TonB-dependent receptor [Bacteroidota bacterium]
MNRKTTILRPVILILVTAACAGSMISGGSGKSGVSREFGVSRQSPEPDPGDTLYYLRGVTISPITAAGRSSPVTFSELNQDEIVLRTSVRDLPVLLSELPSMTTYSENGNGIGYTYLNLRGFDQRRLSVTINGVPQNDPEDHNVYWIDFPDLAANLQGVHVQRGAGSSFYGPPAIGGSVNLVASPFRPDPGITLETMFGFQQFGGTKPRTILNTRKYSVAVNSGPVAERYLFYGRLSTIRSGGYRNNSWVEMNSYFLGAVRSDPGVTTQIHFFGGPISDGLAYYGIPLFAGPDPDLRRRNYSAWETDSAGAAFTFASTRRAQEIENFSQPHFELLNELRLSPRLTISNTFFHYRGDGFFDYDASWADTALLRLGYDYGIPTDANPVDALVRATVENRQSGWLPRVNLIAGGHDLTVGGELRIHRSTHWGKIRYAGELPPGFDPDYHFYEYSGAKDMMSLYAHDIARLSDRVSVMGELQVVRNRYWIGKEKYLGNEFSTAYLFANPRVGLDLRPADRWHSYFSAAYTSREPRLRNLYAAEDSYFGAAPLFRADTAGGTIRYDFTSPLVKPERLVDLELGGGYSAGGIILKGNLFWMEFYDELVKSGQVDIFGQPVTGNADRSRHTGLELEMSATAGPWSLAANMTFSRNRLVRHAIFDDAGNAVRLDGNPVAGFPDIMGNFRIGVAAGPATVSLLAKFVGGFYTDNMRDASRRNPPYWVSDAEVLLRPAGKDSPAGIRLEIRNIFDRLYFQNGEGDAFFPASERNYLVGLIIRL